MSELKLYEWRPGGPLRSRSDRILEGRVWGCAPIERTPSVCDATLRDLAHAPEPADEHLYEAHEEVYEGHEQIEDDPEYLHHEVRHVVEEARRPEDDGDEQYHRYSQQRSTHDASPPPPSPRSYSPA